MCSLLETTSLMQHNNDMSSEVAKGGHARGRGQETHVMGKQASSISWGLWEQKHDIIIFSCLYLTSTH